jgi:hypothetical protein
LQLDTVTGIKLFHRQRLRDASHNGSDQSLTLF